MRLNVASLLYIYNECVLFSCNAQISQEPFGRLGTKFVRLFFGNQQNKGVITTLLKKCSKAIFKKKYFANFDHFKQKSALYAIITSKRGGRGFRDKWNLSIVEKDKRNIYCKKQLIYTFL